MCGVWIPILINLENCPIILHLDHYEEDPKYDICFITYQNCCPKAWCFAYCPCLIRCMFLCPFFFPRRSSMIFPRHLTQRSKQGKSTQVSRLFPVADHLPYANYFRIKSPFVCPHRRPTEKDLGFLRIGSLNVRVKKTTEAFSNFLGVGPGTQQRQSSHPQQRYRNNHHGTASRHRTSAPLAEENEPDGGGSESAKPHRNDHLKAWNSVDDIPVVRWSGIFRWQGL